MAKRDYHSWDKSKLDKFIKEGRGQGELKEYKPWLTIQDFPSRGRVTRLLGWTTKRMHSFFSDLETKCFYLFDWNQRIVDIKEQYPLLLMEDVIKDKKGINFNMFKDKETGCQYVLTTTFLLTVKDKNGANKLVARSVKSASELGRRTTMEKLEIERRYWMEKGIEWKVITQKDINMEKVKNIQWLHSSLHSYQDFDLSQKEMVALCSEFLESAGSSSKAVRVFSKDFDIVNSLRLGTGLFLLKYMIATRIIEINIDKAIDLNVSYLELINWRGEESNASNKFTY